MGPESSLQKNPFYRPNLQLEQVIVLSRHGLRSPLLDMDAALGRFTPYRWPKWEVPPGHLMTKGGVLEVLFGRYFRDLLRDTNLLAEGFCPAAQDISVYANGLQRTLATAQFFTLGAFPACDVPVGRYGPIGTMDPLFDVAVRDGSEDYRQRAIASINANAGPDGLAGLNEALGPLYTEMGEVINLKNAPEPLDNLKAVPSHIRLTPQQDPAVLGPLRLCSSLADVFLAQYYAGTPLSEIAWGRVGDQTRLARLVSLKERYLKLLFASPAIARPATGKLRARLQQTLTQAQPTRVSLWVGHDSNITALLASLDVADYQLPGQLESTPIGGKLLLGKWRNTAGQAHISLDYLYQSSEQICQTRPLNRESPAQRASLRLKTPSGATLELCPLAEFLTRLND